MAKMKQKGLFDESFRLEKISRMGDPLAKLDEVIDWERFRPDLEDLLIGALGQPDNIRQQGAGIALYDYNSLGLIFHIDSQKTKVVAITVFRISNQRFHFAAAPSWLGDAGYYARALEWIVEENRKLPAGNKIRVVSVSAAPSGPGSPFSKHHDQWDQAVERAEKEGILVLDCTSHHGIISPAYFSDLRVSERAASLKAGFPGRPYGGVDQDSLFVPTSPRATAEQDDDGGAGYQYTGRGGLSWGIPYCAGVLAMGWQVSPEMSYQKAVELLFASAYRGDDGNRYINPPAFITMVQAARANR